MVKILDALTLASLDEPTKVQRIAAIWCREFNNRWPESRAELAMWVEHEFGPVIESEYHLQIAKLLLDETRRQIRLRRRRKGQKATEDPLSKPGSYPARVGRLLQSRLGAARAWVSQQRIHGAHTSDCNYIDGAVYSGLVAGLIPVTISLRRIVDPNLLVYRQGQNTAKTWWVPNHITSVGDAFVWVIPEEAAEFLQLPGTRVEHDGEAQAVRLLTQFGTKSLPWRLLMPV